MFALRRAENYWSTLQPGTVSYRAFAKQMVNLPVACRAVKKREPEVHVAEIAKHWTPNLPKSLGYR